MLLAICAVVFIQMAQAMPSPEQIAQFKADYQVQLDTWLDTKTNQTAYCLEALIEQLDQCRHAPYNQMMQYSFHAIGDLGSQSRCVDIDGESAYSVVSLNVSTTPVFIRQGICLPSYCTQGMYNSFSTEVSNRLTTLIQKAIVKFDIGLYILPPDTRVEISIVDTATVYSPSEYNLAVESQSDPGSTNNDVAGVYGPQKSAALFWIISIAMLIWLIAIIAISIKYFYHSRYLKKKQASVLSQPSSANAAHLQTLSISSGGNGTPMSMALAQAESRMEFYCRILSIQYAVSHLAKPRANSPKYNDLKVMDGLRVLCLLWVMTLGVCQFTMSSAVYNPWTLQKYFQTYGYTAVYSSNLGFDEFFFFSSMLMTLKITDLMEESHNHNGKMSVTMYLKMLFFRYVRMAPIYYLVFLVGWQVGPYFGGGPCWFTYEKGFSNCDDYWWSVFTMTINFIPGYVIANEGCYYWGWYPPCELQLFIVMPWIAYMILKIKSNLVQTILVTFGILAGISINFYIIWSNELATGLFAPQDIMIFKIFVIKPYTKFHAIFLGIGMALIYQNIQRWKQRSRQDDSLAVVAENCIWKTLAKSNLFAWVGYIFAISAIGFTTLFPLPANQNPVAWSNLQNSLFISLSRPLFVFAVMVLIICTTLDHGHMFKSAMSRDFWAPLAKLSYLVYLIFPIIDATLISSMNQALFLSYLTMFYLLAFNFAFCIIAAFFCHILIEGPLMNLIFAYRIKEQESEARLQENLKMLDKTVRTADRNEGSSHEQSEKQSPTFKKADDGTDGRLLNEHQRPLSNDYFTTPETTQEEIKQAN